MVRCCFCDAPQCHSNSYGCEHVVLSFSKTKDENELELMPELVVFHINSLLSGLCVGNASGSRHDDNYYDLIGFVSHFKEKVFNRGSVASVQADIIEWEESLDLNQYDDAKLNHIKEIIIYYQDITECNSVNIKNIKFLPFSNMEEMINDLVEKMSMEYDSITEVVLDGRHVKCKRYVLSDGDISLLKSKYGRTKG